MSRKKKEKKVKLWLTETSEEWKPAKVVRGFVITFVNDNNKTWLFHIKFIGNFWNFFLSASTNITRLSPLLLSSRDTLNVRFNIHGAEVENPKVENGLVFACPWGFYFHVADSLPRTRYHPPDPSTRYSYISADTRSLGALSQTCFIDFVIPFPLCTFPLITQKETLNLHVVRVSMSICHHCVEPSYIFVR